MQEPSKNCVSIIIERWRGKWLAKAAYKVGPYPYFRTAEADTYEEAYAAVTDPQG